MKKFIIKNTDSYGEKSFEVAQARSFGGKF